MSFEIDGVKFSLQQAAKVVSLMSGVDAPKTVQSIHSASEKGDGRVVIVRSRDAGVLWGNYQGREGANIHLTNAVQMWQWKAAKGGTLVDCAVYGVETSGCKFSEAASTATVFNACTLINCSAAGVDSLVKVEGGKWK